MPILSSCCFCLDLKVGSKIIGVLNLICALVNSLILAGVLVMVIFMGIGVSVASSTHTAAFRPSGSTVEDDDYVDVRDQQAHNILEMVKEKIESVKIILYVLFALCLLAIITTSMLIHGVKKNRRGLLTPYIVQQVVNTLVIFALLIWILVAFGTDVAVISIALGMVGAMLIHIYFALVVISQYQALGLIRMHEEISMK